MFENQQFSHQPTPAAYPSLFPHQLIATTVSPKRFRKFDESQPLHSRQDWPLADGADGTFQALDLMARAVRGECGPDFSGYNDEYCQGAAMSIAGHLGEDELATGATIAALFYFCRDQIEYIDHPFNVQQVQDCRRTIELGTGDCVSKSVCLSTLLAACGIESHFVAQSLDGREYSHVYVELRDGTALDPVANGKGNRPLGEIGWRQQIPDYGFETPQEIF